MQPQMWLSLLLHTAKIERFGNANNNDYNDKTYGDHCHGAGDDDDNPVLFRMMIK